MLQTIYMYYVTIHTTININYYVIFAFLVLRDMFATFGVPEDMSSDGGPEFTAALTLKFLENWGIKHRISSVSYAQSNGRAEVAVKKAKRILMDNINPNGSLNNDNFLRAMLQARNTPEPDCNVSPAEVVFGRPIRDAFSFVNAVLNSGTLLCVQHGDKLGH